MVGALILLLAVVPFAYTQTTDGPRRGVTDPGVVTTRQAITPAGVPSVFDGRVYGVAFGKTSADLWVLTAGSVFGSDWRENRVFARYTLEGNPGFQGLAFDAARNLALIAARVREHDKISTRMVSIGGTGAATVSEPNLARAGRQSCPIWRRRRRAHSHH